MTKTQEVLIRNVRAWRKAKGWTQKELAKRAEMADQQLSEYLREKSPKEPRLEAIEKIAHALETTVAELLTDREADWRPPQPADPLEATRGLLENLARAAGYSWPLKPDELGELLSGVRPKSRK